MSDYGLPPLCYGILFVLVLAFLNWFLRGGNEHVKPPAQPHSGRALRDGRINDGTWGGRAVKPDPTSRAYLKDNKHLDPWGLGWQYDGELNLPPNDQVIDRWRDSLVNPDLPAHAPKGVEGSRQIEEKIQREYGYDKGFHQRAEQMRDDYRRSNDVLDDFNKGRKR